MKYFTRSSITRQGREGAEGCVCVCVWGGGGAVSRRTSSLYLHFLRMLPLPDDKQMDLGSNPLWLSSLFKGCDLWTLSCDFVPDN